MIRATVSPSLVFADFSIGRLTDGEWLIELTDAEWLRESLAPKNIISLIPVLTMWWCPYVESSLVLFEEVVCYDQCVLLAKLLLAIFAWNIPLVSLIFLKRCLVFPVLLFFSISVLHSVSFILYSKAKFSCYSRYFLTSYFCIPVPCDEKDIFFWC